MIYNDKQQVIANIIEDEPKISNWKDWRWQLRHAIKSLDKFEKLLGVKFDSGEKEELRKTFNKFPLSITPCGTLSKGHSR